MNLFTNLSFCYRDYILDFQLLDLMVNQILFVFIAFSAFLLILAFVHILKFRRFFNFMINFDLLFILLLEFTITLQDIFCNFSSCGSIFHFSLIFNW